MRRGLRITFGLLVILIALAIVNAFVLDGQRQSAKADAPGGEIVPVSSVDLQVIDQPATDTSRPEGEPIVLLHCFSCSSRWWDAMLPQLNEHHRVIRIDLIGHGGSEKPTSGYEIDAQGGAIAEALSQLGVQGATVVGHSLGGLVATSLAETASQLVDRVVLIATPADSDAVELPFISQVIGTPVVGEAAWRLRLDSMIRNGYGSAFASGFDAEGAFEDADRLVEDNRAMTYTSFAETESEAENYLDEQSLVTRLGATGVPTLAIEGAEDQILDPKATAASFGTLLGAEVKTLDGAGHSPNVELPAETAQLVLDFAEADDGLVADAGSPAGKQPRKGSGKKK